MSKESGVIWCHSSVNPVMGCDGCELASPTNPDAATCYAKILHDRRGALRGYAREFFKPEIFRDRMAKAAAWAANSTNQDESKPWLAGFRRLIFISDMGDVLSAGVKRLFGGRDEFFDFLRSEIVENVTTTKGRAHVWLWLTKRPSTMAEFGGWLDLHGTAWPDNLVAITTITDKRSVKRAHHLVDVPAKYRGVSIEPMWEAVGARHFDRGSLSGIDWLICGGEAGREEMVKPFDLSWAEQLQADCDRSGVAFFMKQLGRRPYWSERAVDEVGFELKDPKGENWDEWPPAAAGLKTRDLPKGWRARA